MKLNIHPNQLYMYTIFGESDGFRKLNLFEDFDETFLNFEITATEKLVEYLTEIDAVFQKNQTKEERCENFYSEYFR